MICDDAAARQGFPEITKEQIVSPGL